MMIPILTAVLILLFSVSLVFGMDKAVVLIGSTVSASNLSSNKINVEEQGVLAQEKPNLTPQSKGLLPPEISAASALVQDVNSSETLFSKNPDARVPIASTTKIMTALVSVEHFKANDELQVLDLSRVSGASMGLKVGEKITYRSLLYGMLLNSGNDAAYTIAQNYPGELAGFVLAMNNKTKELGLLNTRFTNPAGFDSPAHYSSAADLARIAEAASNNGQLMRVVGTKHTQVSSVDKSEIHNLTNLNRLLSLPGVMGFKTGYTPLAKENFVGLVERDKHRIITVVLGSNDRFGETEKLIEWVYKNFQWNY